jgi:hypothetical protein
MNRTRLWPVLGAVAVIGPVVFTTGWLVSTSASGTQEWGSDISALAALDAPRPWITTAGELAFAGSLLALAAGLVISLVGRDVAVGAGMLAVTGLAIAAQALAREDCDTGLAACIARQQAGVLSWHHSLHEYASVLAFMTSLAAPIILARPFRDDPRWRPLARYSVLTTCVGLALLLGYAAAPDAWTGILQRAFVTIPAAWTAVVGTACGRYGRSSSIEGRFSPVHAAPR